MSRLFKKDSIETFVANLEFLLWKAGFDISINATFCYQYDDPDDTRFACTSKKVPSLRNENELEMAYQIGYKGGIHFRDYDEIREFIIKYEEYALSFSFIIVHIGLSEYQKYYGDKILIHDSNWKAVKEDAFNTFIDFLITSFLLSYRSPQPISADDAIRSAGERYINYLLCGKSQAKNINIHNDINVLSSLQYEKQSNSGKLIISPLDIIPQLDVVLEKAVPLYHYNKTRKLFEIATDGAFLVGDSRAIYGIATKETLKKTNYEEYLQIQIHAPLNWEILSYSPKRDTYQPLVQYNNSHYRVKPQNSELEDFKAVLRKRNPSAHIYEIVSIVQAACNQSHGTTIVFTPNAAEEAERLKASCFRIKPTRIQHITKQVTAIDGAVLCDLTGTCYAIGIILDGVSSESEDISRGARHNSAKRYKASHPESTICVISEDGGMTIE